MHGVISGPMRSRRWQIGAKLLLIATVPSTVSADPDRAVFIEKNRCALVERLRSIHLRGPRSTSKDRFLVAAPFGAPGNYVQCIFFDDDTKMLCEAASGLYGIIGDLMDAPTSDATLALQSLGFTLERLDGNFTREIDLGMPPDFDGVADLMLSALHDGYRVGSNDALDFTAPMALPYLDGCPGPIR